MRVLSIQVGRPRTVEHEGDAVTSGIWKAPVEGPVWLRTLNLDGDQQADLTVHGGRDKALYSYSHDAYPAWRALRPNDVFENGALGENLTVDVIDEKKVCIGDVYALGAALVQVSQPRLPCYKLGVKFDDPQILRQFITLARPGVYFRVLQEGQVQSGDELRFVSREPVEVSVAEVFVLAAHGSDDEALLERVLRVQAMPEQWLSKAAKCLRLARPSWRPGRPE